MIIDTAPKGEYEFGAIHDALTEGKQWRERKFTDAEILKICEALPKMLHLKAVEWSWSDTEVRDDVFVWAQQNVDVVNKLLEAE